MANAVVFVCEVCPNKAPQTRWLKTTQICYLSSGGQKSNIRCQKGHASSEACRGYWPSCSSSDRSCISTASASVFTRTSPCVHLSLIRTLVVLDRGPILMASSFPIISAMPLFPNKVLEVRTYLFGGHNLTHNSC